MYVLCLCLVKDKITSTWFNHVPRCQVHSWINLYFDFQIYDKFRINKIFVTLVIYCSGKVKFQVKSIIIRITIPNIDKIVEESTILKIFSFKFLAIQELPKKITFLERIEFSMSPSKFPRKTENHTPNNKIAFQTIFLWFFIFTRQILGWHQKEEKIISFEVKSLLNLLKFFITYHSSYFLFSIFRFKQFMKFYWIVLRYSLLSSRFFQWGWEENSLFCWQYSEKGFFN